MSFPNQPRIPYQQPLAQEFQQQAPMQQPNNFIPQPPLGGQMNETPPPMQQQQHQAFQPYAQQAQYPPHPNPQQQHMPMNPRPIPNYVPTPPLMQGQGFAPPLGDGHSGAGPVRAGNSAAGKERKSSLVRAKMQFKGRDIWVGGESHVGRKGKDGEWTEVKGCSVM